MEKGKLKVYLCGSIRGLSRKEAEEWRKRATRLLKKEGFEVINPLRGRAWAYATEQSKFTFNEIVDRDLWDVYRSDILLVEYTDPNRSYTGTTVEMVMAKLWNKPRIVWIDNNKECNHWLDWLSTKKFTSLKEACRYIAINYGGKRWRMRK